MRQSALYQQAVRRGAIAPIEQLEIQRRPRETAEQVMRQEPQLGAGPRREDEKKPMTRNENNIYNLHSQLKRNSFQKSDQEFAKTDSSAAQNLFAYIFMSKLVGICSTELGNNALTWLLLTPVHLPQI